MTASNNFWIFCGVALIVVGVVIVVLAIRVRGSVKQVSASKGGVAIGGNNSGRITTRTSSSSPAWNIVGTVIAILGLVVAACAWLLPQAP